MILYVLMSIRMQKTAIDRFYDRCRDIWNRTLTDSANGDKTLKNLRETFTKLSPDWEQQLKNSFAVGYSEEKIEEKLLGAQDQSRITVFDYLVSYYFRSTFNEYNKESKSIYDRISDEDKGQKSWNNGEVSEENRITEKMFIDKVLSDYVKNKEDVINLKDIIQRIDESFKPIKKIRNNLLDALKAYDNRHNSTSSDYISPYPDPD